MDQQNFISQGIDAIFAGASVLLEAFLDLLELVYKEPEAAFILSGLMLISAFALRFWAWLTKTRPYVEATLSRVTALKLALGDDTDPDLERHAFASNFDAVKQALGDEKGKAGPLVQAWREFAETIVDETASTICNTTRPSAYFNRAAPRLTRLAFWSNIFVAAGLVLTFLGLVVALHMTARSMGDVSQTKTALVGLLTVASAKFLTSIAGIVSSVIIRWGEQSQARRIGSQTDQICALLERGLLYIPPQRLAAQQLEVLREQRDELKTFNTDFALQVSEKIGMQFQQAIAPMASAMTNLNDHMANMGADLGQSAAKAVEEASGGELRALAQTLGALGEQLNGLGGTISASGDDAASQIRAAGQDFAHAASDIKAAFDKLAGKVEGVGEQISAQNETMTAKQNAAVSRMLDGLGEAQNRSANAMHAAVGALQDAGRQAATEMQQQVGSALAESISKTKEVVSEAIEESGANLRSSSMMLADAVRQAASEVGTAGTSFERTGSSAREVASSMDNIVTQARSAANTLADSYTGLERIAAPISQAVHSIKEASDLVATAIETSLAANNRAQEKLEELMTGIESTQEAAENAWHEYRNRFEGVDKELEQTLLKMSQALGDTLTNFKDFAGQFDSQMGAAVEKFSSSLTTIEDYAGTLDEFAETLRKQPKEAAE